jgi:NAD-dependent protein deacetylase/lipoamidase
MFERAPEEVWRWYLHRFGACRHAEPNAGHAALVRLERALGDRFTLVTQNIDGLHRRAGSRNVYRIHGDAAWVRCAAESGAGLLDLPAPPARGKGDPFTKEDRARGREPGAEPVLGAGGARGAGLLRAGERL